MMLPRLSSFFHRLSSGSVTLAALIAFSLFVGLILPGQSAQMERITHGAGSPDTSFFYSKDDLYRMAGAYGEAGRAAYVRVRFTFDLVWPLVYLYFLGTSLSWSLARALPEGNRWRMLNLTAVFGWLFDMLENIAASVVMLNYPSHTPVLDLLTPIYTLIKWFFVGGSFVILIPVFLIAVWKVIRSRK
jgi:hypothetical protein